MVKTKCKECGKKIPALLVDMYRCKCLKLYCSSHLQAHDCKFNHFENHKENISKTLEQIVSKKIEKI